MIDLDYFREDTDEAREILAGLGQAISRQTGRPCTVSLAKTLTQSMVARVLELEADAFGAEEVAFGRAALDEVRADPDALFLLLTIDGRIEGCCFGYWEWPDQVTVAGTDFFLDTVMISRRYRGLGIGRIWVSGVILLVELLECHQMGIAAWTAGPLGDRLIDFYRGLGFVETGEQEGRNALMTLSLDDAPLETWRSALGLAPTEATTVAPPVGRGSRAGRLWPSADEFKLLGRFYAAMGFSEALFLVAPFEFAYLYLVMKRPEWAVIPVIAATAAALVAGFPAGILADRWSRKVVVLCGGVLAGMAVAAVPLAVSFKGMAQLNATCVAFAVMGAGEMFMGGAAEAWVVDNLHVAGRRDLVSSFFAHSRSVTALGGMLSACGALVLLLSTTVDSSLLDLLWLIGGGGLVLSALLSATIPEHRPKESETREQRPWIQGKQALKSLISRRALLMIAIAIVLTTLSGAASDEAFTVALVTKGFDARLFAPLSIVDNLIGVIGPLMGIALARRLGTTRLLALFLTLEVVAVTVLFASRGIVTVLVLYVILDLLDDVWDPVAIARLQSLTPSSHRATIGTLVYQICTVAELIALGGFTLLLGSHSEALEAATPDLLQAFSGQAQATPPAPNTLFGLPVPDLAIVLFIGIGLLAVPFVLASGRGKTRRSRQAKPPDDKTRIKGAHPF